MKRLFTLITAAAIAHWAQAQTSGGPDAFGYTWRNSNHPEGPVFDWVDITAIGTEVTGLGDDNASPFITMGGMTFRYYWTDVTKMIFGSNGWLGFSTASNIAHCFPSIPTQGGAADHFLAPFMTDLTITQPGLSFPRVYYYYEQENDRFIVSYVNCPWWSPNAPGYVGPNTFQVILDGNDRSITYQYQSMSQGFLNDMPTCNFDLVIGMENVTGGIGLQVMTETVPANNFAIKFYYPDPVTYQVQDVSPVWNQNFGSRGQFVVANNPVALQAGISNVGNAAVSTTVNVNASLSTLGMSQVYAGSASIEDGLAPAAIASVSFPATGALPAGQYFYNVTTTNAQDLNPGNNSRQSEITAVDMSQGNFVLSYATGGLPTGAASWAGGVGESGFGVKMAPPSYPATLEAVELYFQGAPQLFMLRILSEDGGNGLPGSVLHEQTVSGGQYLADQWTTIQLTQPVEITSGSFIIGWVHLNNTTVQLGTETSGPISRQTYELIADSWAEYRENSNTELLIRARMSGVCGGFSVAAQNIIHPSCHGSSDGAITVTASGGQGAVQYSWNHGLGSVQNPTGLNAGVYVLQVTDGQGCTTSLSVTLNQPAQIVVTPTVNEDDGSGNGAISLTISGGAGGYQVSWAHGPSGTLVSGLTNGTYTATVTDASGCSVTVDVTVGPASIGSLVRSAFSISPNPSDGIIRVIGQIHPGKLSMTDLLGRDVPFTASWDSDGATLRIEDAAPGTYLLIHQGEAGRYAARVVVR